MLVKDLGYMESANLLLSSMSRLTTLRSALQEPPFQALYTMLEHLADGNAVMAADTYHALSHSLLCGPYRRVSGDLFKDFLLWLILERENPFSCLAAQNIWDEPLSGAMRGDLNHLMPFFGLNSILIKRWLGDCFRNQSPRTKPIRDNLSVISSAVWGGNTFRPLPPLTRATEKQEAATTQMASRSFNEGDLLSWRYDPEAQTANNITYVADAAMEELYRRFLETPEPGLLLDDLWNFHASYGTGCFLKNRFFSLDKPGVLTPITPALLQPEDYYAFYYAQRETAIKNIINFMRDESYQNILITGGSGCGKTTLVFSLASELPEMRLIKVLPNMYGDLVCLLPDVLKQPLKFCLFLDDFSENDLYWPLLKSAISPAGVQKSNLLVIAACRESKQPFFSLDISLPAPLLKDFIELVQLMLIKDGVDADFDTVQNACIDYAASPQSMGVISLSHAGMIADTIKNS